MRYLDLSLGEGADEELLPLVDGDRVTIYFTSRLWGYNGTGGGGVRCGAGGRGCCGKAGGWRVGRRGGVCFGERADAGWRWETDHLRSSLVRRLFFVRLRVPLVRRGTPVWPRRRGRQQALCSTLPMTTSGMASRSRLSLPWATQVRVGRRHLPTPSHRHGRGGFPPVCQRTLVPAGRLYLLRCTRGRGWRAPGARATLGLSY